MLGSFVAACEVRRAAHESTWRKAGEVDHWSCRPWVLPKNMDVRRTRTCGAGVHAHNDSLSVTALRFIAFAMRCAAAISAARESASEVSNGGGSIGGGGKRGELFSSPAGSGM